MLELLDGGADISANATADHCFIFDIVIIVENGLYSWSNAINNCPKIR